MTGRDREYLQDSLEEYRRDAQELGITLQEYLLLRLLAEVEQIPYRGSGE